MTDDQPDKPIMQLKDELSRTVVEGHRTDDGAVCSLVAVHESTGAWVLHPHADPRLGVRLIQAEARTLAQAILAGEHKR
ncbi:MAG: hypothetical protein ACRDTG_01750 [Pseudonocardiaceae bacterium]